MTSYPTPEHCWSLQTLTTLLWFHAEGCDRSDEDMEWPDE